MLRPLAGCRHVEAAGRPPSTGTGAAVGPGRLQGPSVAASGSRDLSAGISLYEHANFDGASALIQSSARRLRAFDGPCEHTDTDANGSTSTTTDWNDCLSSIRVAPGWRAILYTNDDFKGQSLEVTGEVANLQLVAGGCDHDGLNDCVSSIAVIAP